LTTLFKFIEESACKIWITCNLGSKVSIELIVVDNTINNDGILFLIDELLFWFISE
jgi:hypothetical protein